MTLKLLPSSTEKTLSASTRVRSKFILHYQVHQNHKESREGGQRNVSNQIYGGNKCANDSFMLHSVQYSHLWIFCALSWNQWILIVTIHLIHNMPSIPALYNLMCTNWLRSWYMQKVRSRRRNKLKIWLKHQGISNVIRLILSTRKALCQSQTLNRNHIQFHNHFPHIQLTIL